MSVIEATGPIKFAAIAAASLGDNTIIALVSGRRLRVLSYVIVAAGAVSAKFQSGATTDLTGLMSLAANGGVSAPFSPVGHFETLVGEALTISLGGAVALAGHVAYQEIL